MSTQPGEDPAEPDVTRLRMWARVVLVPVGLIGAALSFASIYEAARPTYGPAHRRAVTRAAVSGRPGCRCRTVRPS